MILVLRPEGKAQQTADLLNQHAQPALPIGLIKIQTDQEKRAHLKASFEECLPDAIIVTSTYAGGILLSLLKEFNQSDPSKYKALISISVYCVGLSCVEQLKPIFQHVYHGQAQDSESLLSHPKLNQSKVLGKSIFILKGHQGRSLLRETLSIRKAHVSEFNLYHREAKPDLIRNLDCAEQQIDCIIATSQELCEIALTHQSIDVLKMLTWIVVSERIRQFLLSCGITKVKVSAGPQSQALLACVKQLKEN